MKASAIIRIVVFSLVFLMLLGILLGGLCLNFFVEFIPSGDETTIIREVPTGQFRNIEIDWAAGSVNVMVGYTDAIVIKETKDSNNPHTMVTEFDSSTLKITYGSNTGFQLGVNTGKDLIVMIPKQWHINNLEINGAALEVNVENVNLNSIKLNGAAMDMTFKGELRNLECGGAGAKLDITCNNSINSVSVDGAGCQLDLKLPGKCGFNLTSEGLGMNFESEFKYAKNGSTYTYGNEHCKIDVSGLACKVSVNPS